MTTPPDAQRIIEGIRTKSVPRRYLLALLENDTRALIDRLTYDGVLGKAARAGAAASTRDIIATEPRTAAPEAAPVREEDLAARGVAVEPEQATPEPPHGISLPLPSIGGEAGAPIPRGIPPEPTRGTRPAEDIADQVAAARERTNPEPSPAQAESGVYAKGRVNYHGLPFVIETPSATERRGIDERTGEPWTARMPAGVDYGYFSRTEAADSDHVDAYLGSV